MLEVSGRTLWRRARCPGLCALALEPCSPPVLPRHSFPVDQRCLETYYAPIVVGQPLIPVGIRLLNAAPESSMRSARERRPSPPYWAMLKSVKAFVRRHLETVDERDGDCAAAAIHLAVAA